MDLFTRENLRALLAHQASPSISLFMPTHRIGSEQDPIRWRRHLVEVEDRLVQSGQRAAEAKKLLEPARQLLDEVNFWKFQSDGLAAFLAPDFLRVFRLPIPFKDRIDIANRFSLIPLLPMLSGDGRFFVLAMSQNSVRLLQGTRQTVNEVNLNGVPRNLAEALLSHDRDEPLNYHTRPTPGGGWTAIYSGQGVGIDDKKDDLLRYFRRINEGLHPLLREEKAPLVLAAVDYLLPLYREANTYAHLVEGGIPGNPDSLSNAQLHEKAWPLVQPLFESAQRDAVAQYQQLVGTGHASGDLQAVVAAAYEGRVQTLFVALDRQIWGVFDATAGRVEQRPEAAPGDVDLLDFAAAHTLSHGHTVYAVPSEQVPSGTSVAAVFCPPLTKLGKRG